MTYDQLKTKDIKWTGFKIPSNLRKRINKAKGTVRFPYIEARAKSLLTNLLPQYYVSSLTNWKSQMTMQELDFATELKDSWKKKYYAWRKKQEKAEAIQASQQADKALKGSKGAYKNKKQKKWNKNKNNDVLLSSPDFFEAQKLNCVLCRDRKTLFANNESYPCPACCPKKEEPPKPKKKAIKKPNLGQRKLKLKQG